MIVLLHCLLAAVIAQSPALRVEGRVVDAAGKPAEGAVVFLSSIRFGWPMGAVLEAQGKCDGAGSFALDVPEGWLRRVGYKRLTLWAVSSEEAFAGIVYEVDDIPAGRRVELKLAQPKESALEVQDADGKPVVGARVEPILLDLGNMRENVPVEVSACLGATTDARGVAKLRGLPLTKICGLRVEGASCGRQSFTDFTNQTLEWTEGRLRLEPVASVEVVMKGDVPAASVPVEVTLTSFGTPKAGEERRRNVQSTATVRVGPDGHARIEAIAAGGLMPEIEARSGEVQRPTCAPVTLVPGSKNEIEIVWRKGVRVTGRVLTAGLGSPVPGARITWFQYPTKRCELVTDEDGRFTTYAFSGAACIEDIEVEPPLVGLHLPGRRDYVIPDGVSEHDMGELRLATGVRVFGWVHDLDEQAVPGALVHASWSSRMESRSMNCDATAVADQHGNFAIEQVPEGEALTVRAWLGSKSVAEPVHVEAHPGLPIAITLGVLPRVAMRGKIVDEAGKAVEGAEVDVWERSGDEKRWQDKRLNANALRTDPTGAFETERNLVPEKRYCFRIEAPGCVPWRSAWLTPDAGTDLRATVRRLERYEGVLRDPDGEPLAGARVSTRDAPGRADTVTDDEGRFVLEGVMPGRAILVVEAKGHPVEGRIVQSPSELAEWRLESPQETRSRSMHTLEPPLERKRELDIAWSLAGPAAKAALEGKKPDEIYLAMVVTAWIDPGWTLARMEEGVLDTFRADIVRSRAVQSLTKSFTNDALLLSKLEQSATARAYDLVRISDALPPEQRERRLELLSEALAETQQIDSPDHAVVYRAKVARSLLRSGNAKEAREILDRDRDVAEKLSKEEWSGYARSMYAEALSHFDLDRALRMVGEQKDNQERIRHQGNIALELAGVDPAGAERALKLAEQKTYPTVTRWMPGVCYAMAPVDRERARRLAKEHGHEMEGFAVGMMAAALADSDPEAALDLLEDAYANLARFAAPLGNRAGKHDFPALAAALLPVVERIDPTRVREFLWRALAMRQGRAAGQMPNEGYYFASDIGLALFVARYDRELARGLLDPALAALRSVGLNTVDYQSGESLAAALALVDPERGAEIVGELQPRARSIFANVLARTGEDRWRYVQEEVEWMWVIGKDDP